MTGFIEAVEKAQDNERQLRQEANSLLFMLRSFHVVDLVNKEFLDNHSNEAPGHLLWKQIEEVQKLLDSP